MKFATLLLIATALTLAGCKKAPKFEKVTIQVHEPNPFDAMAPNLHFGRFVAQDQTLLDLVAFAYDVEPSQVSGPPQVRENSFNVFGDLPKDATADQVRAMLRGLLEERFKVVAHTESKESDFLVMTVAPGGPKFKEAPPDPSWEPDSPLGFQFAIPLRDTMSRWAEVLTQLVMRPVLDRTGLKGKYSASLGMHLTDDPVEEAQRELTTQLGLRLEPRKEKLTMVVVEKAEPLPVEKKP